jgi:hypothetical protein
MIVVRRFSLRLIETRAGASYGNTIFFETCVCPSRLPASGRRIVGFSARSSSAS